MTLTGKLVMILLALGLTTACEQHSGSDTSIDRTPPPLPENTKTVDFKAASETTGEASFDSQVSDQKSAYWGVKPGEPIPLKWEDLLPDGAEEALVRQQEEFYAMLEQRYMANATTLADAKPFDQIDEGSTLDYMPQLGTFDVVEGLNAQVVRIPGYVVPFDFDKNRRQTEFLFVPYMGACIHTPPPPPNQVIFVNAATPIRLGDIWSPYWLEGTLSTEANRNEVGNAAYTLALEHLEPYTR